MTRHLTDEEIADWVVAGGRGHGADAGNAAQQEHVAGCAECRAQTAGLHRAIAGFRAAAATWAAGQQPPFCVPVTAPFWRQATLQWGVAMAVLALVLAVPAQRSYHAHQAAAQELAARELLADTALLQRVDAQISRVVPNAMAPLVTPVFAP